MNTVRSRTGSVLPVVVIVCTIVGLLGFFVMNRSLQSSRVAGWSRDHLAVKLLAESAAEEIFWHIQTRVNDPTADTFQLFRKLEASKGSMPLSVPGVDPVVLTKDLTAQAKLFGGVPTIKWTAKIEHWQHLHTWGHWRGKRGGEGKGDKGKEGRRGGREGGKGDDAQDGGEGFPWAGGQRVDGDPDPEEDGDGQGERGGEERGRRGGKDRPRGGREKSMPEGHGVLAIDVTVHLGAVVGGTTEVFKMKRPFRIAHAAVPSPIAQMAILDRNPLATLTGAPSGGDGDKGDRKGGDRDGDKGDRKGGDRDGDKGDRKDGDKGDKGDRKGGDKEDRKLGIYVASTGSPVPLPLMATSFRSLKGQKLPGLWEAFRGLMPLELIAQSQFVAREPMQLKLFMMMRLMHKQAVSGVYLCFGENPKHPLMLQFEDFKTKAPLEFRGKALIVSMGPVVVGDIHVHDPTTDCLTIVSGGMITVMGKKVDANLVSIGGKNRGITFSGSNTINGTAVMQDMLPLNGDLIGLGLSQIGPPAAWTGGPVPPEQDPTIVVAFAPSPSEVRHGDYKAEEGWEKHGGEGGPGEGGWRRGGEGRGGEGPGEGRDGGLRRQGGEAGGGQGDQADQ